MREGLDAPTLQLPADNVDEIRAYLDGQSRITVAIWVRHEQQGLDGPLFDHHLMLGVDDRDWETGDMRALEEGMRIPALQLGEPTWIDLFPLSELEPLRSFGTVLWEQTVPGEDPLDYRLTSEPFEPDSRAVESFAARVAALPAVRCVGADVLRLWKGDDEVEAQVRLFVDAPIETEALPPVLDAARASVLAGWTRHSAEIGRPHDSAAILYGAVT